MNVPGPDCVKSVEFHGIICITREDWEKVKEKEYMDGRGHRAACSCRDKG